MSARLGGFVLGILATLAILVVGGYLFITAGGVPMETTAAPLPLEATVAGLAIKASLRGAADKKDPLPLNDDNLLAGAKTFKENCAPCHGIPGEHSSVIAKGMFPPPPQLFEHDEMVTDDPEGVTFWIVTHGIRLSGMPGFASTLPDQQRWQVTMLLAHADKLPPAVQSALSAH
jgi:mono/diheme cytochrome c family protein